MPNSTLFAQNEPVTEPLSKLSYNQARDAVYNACAVIGIPPQTRLVPTEILTVNEYESEKNRALTRTAGFINSEMSVRVSGVKTLPGDARPRTRVQVTFDARKNNESKGRKDPRIESLSTIVETDSQGIDRIRQVEIQFVDTKEAGKVIYRPYAIDDQQKIEFIPAPGTQRESNQAGTLGFLTLRQQIVASTIGRSNAVAGDTTKKVILAIAQESSSLSSRSSIDDFRHAIQTPEMAEPNVDLEAGIALIQSSVEGHLDEIVRNERLAQINMLMGVYRDRTKTATVESENELRKVAIRVLEEDEQKRRVEHLRVGLDYYRAPFANTPEDAQRTIENIAGALGSFGLLREAGRFQNWETRQLMHNSVLPESTYMQTLVSDINVGKCNVTVGACVKPRNTTDSLTVFGCTAPASSDIAVHSVYWLEYSDEEDETKSTAVKLQHKNDKGEVTAECVVTMVGDKSVIKFSHLVRKVIQRPYTSSVVRYVMEECPVGELDPDTGRVMLDYAIAMVDDRTPEAVAFAIKLRKDETFDQTELDKIARFKKGVEERILAELTPDDKIIPPDDTDALVMEGKFFGEKEYREDVTVRSLDLYKPEAIARVRRTLPQDEIFDIAERQAHYAQDCAAKLAVAVEGKTSFDQIRKVAASAATGMRMLAG